MLTVIVFTFEQAISFLPNIQLTTLLFIVYSRVFGTKKTLIVIVLHVIADNLLYGTITPFTVLPMLIAWSLVPLTLNTIFKRYNSVIFMMVYAFVFGFVYGWIYLPFSVYYFGVNPLAYFMSDLPFEFLMGASGSISVGALYEPLLQFLGCYDFTTDRKRSY